jgi:pyrimidine-nucleoside phosphorylase
VLRAAELIERKRDGGELPAAEIAELVLAYARGEVPDEQMAAFCMAVYFRGLTPAETYALTDSMIRSGEVIDLSALGRVAVDKHSTGGVGDKTSIALGPVVAACGVPFAKMSGRGLGHTGGTLDKLESIPGFRIELSPAEFLRQVGNVGLAVIGQTANLVPADKRLYALRDVTATVEEVSLIAASIMSKKIAAGAGAILLDVKVGEGAFMKTLDRARTLARTMLALGARAGRRVVCELTAMDEPLGRAVGNAVEVREAVATLRGEGPPDFTDLVLRSAGQLLALSDLGIEEAEGRRQAEAAVASGSALEAYARWVEAQGGNPDEAVLPRAPVVRPVPAPVGGYVVRLHGLLIGQAAVHLGAGRMRKEDPVDHATGIVCLAKEGDRVEAGQALAEVHARDETSAVNAVAEVGACYELGLEPPEPRPLVLDVIA